jgi:hypothetical protein
LAALGGHPGGSKERGASSGVEEKRTAKHEIIEASVPPLMWFLNVRTFQDLITSMDDAIERTTYVSEEKVSSLWVCPKCGNEFETSIWLNASTHVEWSAR